MKMELSADDVKKILSTISTEEIENKLESNWAYWDVGCTSNGEVKLTKKSDVEKKHGE